MLCTLIGNGDVGNKMRSLCIMKLVLKEAVKRQTANKIIVVINMGKIKKINIIKSDLRGGSGPPLSDVGKFL